jgi:glycosyltransferase involved in cell wall biosynthesis
MSSATDATLLKELSELRGEPVEIIDPEGIPCIEISDKCSLPENPLVSVHMITYNHEPYIAEAIEGVLLQKTSFPIELVIGEDCSTDRTRDIVMHYQKKFPGLIRVITSERNVGATKNSLRTERACRGKYIAYCEGDDYWHHPRKLQKEVDYLEAHPHIVLVHSDVDAVKVETGDLISRLNRYEGIDNTTRRKDLFLSVLEHQYVIRTATVCLRRDVLEKCTMSDPVVFQSNRFLMGDTPCWLELSRIGDFHYINESLATYRILPESACHTKSLEKGKAFGLSILDMVLYYADKYNCSFEAKKRIRRKFSGGLLRVACMTADAELGRKVKSLVLHLTFFHWMLYIASQNKQISCVVRLINYCRKKMIGVSRYIRQWAFASTQNR